MWSSLFATLGALAIGFATIGILAAAIWFFDYSQSSGAIHRVGYRTDGERGT